MGFFLAVTACKNDCERLVRLFFAVLVLKRFETLMHAVGDHVMVRRRGLVFEDIADEARRIMDGIHIAIEPVIEIMVDQLCCKAGILQEDMGSEVFRLAVETRRNGNALRAADLERRAAEHERDQHMHDVRAFDRLFERLLNGFRERYAVLLEILFQKQKIILRNDEEIRLPLSLRVGADYADMMALGLHTADKIHRRSGRSVVLFAENVAYNRDVHCCSKRFCRRDPF